MYRVVGTLEYLSALRHLDAFLHSASSEELDAADKIVSSRPQYAVFTGMSDRFRQSPAVGQTSSNNQTASPKKGLMWVVALARMEAGAIMGTFTTLSNPFEVVGPTRWEMPAYKELLIDGAQTHYLAISNDANVATVAMKVPDSETLSYIRRLNLARSMLSAAARSKAQEMSLQEWSQVELQDKQLLTIRDRFAQRVSRHLDLINSNATSQTPVSDKLKSNAKACSMQLLGERRELLAGTATVQTFNYKR
jgi:hypothetical protein